MTQQHAGRSSVTMIRTSYSKTSTILLTWRRAGTWSFILPNASLSQSPGAGTLYATPVNCKATSLILSSQLSTSGSPSTDSSTGTSIQITHATKPARRWDSLDGTWRSATPAPKKGLTKPLSGRRWSMPLPSGTPTLRGTPTELKNATTNSPLCA